MFSHSNKQQQKQEKFSLNLVQIYTLKGTRKPNTRPALCIHYYRILPGLEAIFKKYNIQGIRNLKVGVWNTTPPFITPPSQTIESSVLLFQTCNLYIKLELRGKIKSHLFPVFSFYNKNRTNAVYPNIRWFHHGNGRVKPP